MAVPAVNASAGVQILVDSQQVDNLIDAAWRAVSGPSLEEFLIESVHPYFQEEIVNRFANAGDRQTGPWKPLSEATQNIRRQLGYEPEWPINVRSGQDDEGGSLFSLAAYEADFKWSEDSAEMNLPGDVADPLLKKKLETAQMGSTNNPIPGFGPTDPRPVLAADETDLEALLLLLSEHITNAMAGFIGGEFIG